MDVSPEHSFNDKQPKHPPSENNNNLNKWPNKKKTKKKKKKRSNTPVELPNNVSFNPYRSNKFSKKPGKGNKMLVRDPRFSEHSGKLNLDMFRRSYSFLEEMRKEEVKEITRAIKINKKFGTESLKGIESMKKISHLNISNLDEAKRALDRYKSENAHLQKKEELRKLKKSLVQEEKNKISLTGKKPYYFSDKKVKKIYKEMNKKKIEESLKSTEINYGPNKAIHKKLESQSRRLLPKERKLNMIPKFRDV
ncbi:hypothetical protein TpMuguga_04g00856 [Theileria parva strain Muguga]|uniref:rRNA biogenesis protein RRP36 n=1 Tax=Theileria parva TaxID=5875 RepID=Q4N193_THEPA|nr:uncharacterized protein TpMuguga_04g00856 [Theileria parva strain Muguga]EAN32210.1 hypothetical protein TpMuguga_04g00856 [Theileria parva strain Muguga]|eukprot:XP_764493.1 hypothetical protein [Theileria parva strain Muguga]